LQITPEQLMAEAGQMALELRLKDQALEALEAEVKRLRALQESPADAADDRILTRQHSEDGHGDLQGN
jgi:hypothetical protein